MNLPDDRGSGPSATFRSILFDRDEGSIEAAAREPAFFADLHLDQIVASVTAGREEYELAPFFYRPLHAVEAVHYRHRVLSDLEQGAVLEAVSAFAAGMGRMRKHLGAYGQAPLRPPEAAVVPRGGLRVLQRGQAFAERLAALELQLARIRRVTRIPDAPTRPRTCSPR